MEGFLTPETRTQASDRTPFPFLSVSGSLACSVAGDRPLAQGKVWEKLATSDVLRELQIPVLTFSCFHSFNFLLHKSSFHFLCCIVNIQRCTLATLSDFGHSITPTTFAPRFPVNVNPEPAASATRMEQHHVGFTRDKIVDRDSDTVLW